VLSGLDTFDAAVEALQLGAFDYLAKPPEIPRVRVAVRNALDQIELTRERRRLYAELEDSNAQLAEKVEQLQTVCGVLEEQASTIQADLNRAEVIQRALLPQQPPLIPGFCMETLYRPGSSVGGDFYDASVLNGQYLTLVVADAAGHGVAAAMLSVLFKLRLQQIDREGNVLEPMAVLELLNQRLFDMLCAPGAFITAAYVLIELRTGQGRLASAGHPPCLLTSPDESARLLERTGPALGLEPRPSYTEHEFELQQDARLLIYTDGVLEGGPDSPDAGALAAAMSSVTIRSELLDGLYQDAVRHTGSDRDDITMLLLERSEGDSHFDEVSTDITEPADETDAPSPEPFHIARGSASGTGFIAIIGTVTWLCSHTLLETARELLARETRLTLDLSRCDHLDSTCMGTLHEIVTSHQESVALQGVTESVRKLFEELSMTAVLDHIRDDREVLPEDMSLVATTSLSPRQQGERILSAHEILASLSEENEAQFRAVVDSLRSDLP
jgi:serine phosphatase RsbU (regulator of sigma subunit)/ABC-type transporter Mla MlaB component